MYDDSAKRNERLPTARKKNE